jgi:hypothetical protein
MMWDCVHTGSWRRQVGTGGRGYICCVLGSILGYSRRGVASAASAGACQEGFV